MQFEFGIALSLYESQQHPRVFISQPDVLKLGERVRAGIGRKIMDALREKAAGLTETILDADDLVGLLKEGTSVWESPGTYVLFGLHDLSMVAAVDNDTECMEVVRRVLCALPKLKKQGCRGLGRYGVQSPFSVACSYDLMFHKLSPKKQQRCGRWMLSEVLRPTLRELRPRFLKGAGGNIAVVKMLTALAALLAIWGDPGLPDLSEEKKDLITFFLAAVHSAIGPEGYPEEDIGYGTMIAAKLIQMAEALTRAGFINVWEECPRLSRFGRAALHFVQPWGEFLAVTGDRGDDFQQREFCLSRLATRTNDPSLLWLLGTLSGSGVVYPISKQPHDEIQVRHTVGMHIPASAFSLAALDDLQKPEYLRIRLPAVHPLHANKTIPTAFRDSARGIVSFRSGWDKDATLLIFDGSQRSPAVQGHAHASSGHFSLTALGEYFAIDTGRYNNEQDQHNVVLIEGKSGESTDGRWSAVQRHGLLTGCQPGDFVDAASADSSHQYDCCWARRTVGLVRGRHAPAYVWTVEDINHRNDWSDYWWCCNTSPENVIKTFRRKATITGWRCGNHLDIHFVLPPKNGYPRPHALTLARDEQTTNSYRYVADPTAEAAKFERPSNMIHRSAFVRPRLIAKVAGYNGRFMSLMLPRQKGDKPATVKSIPCLDNSLAVRITFSKVEDTLIFAYEHQLLEADGIKARGNWCVVRRSRSNGRVLSAELSQGTSLVVDGRAILVE
jgi:hypothetical protein